MKQLFSLFFPLSQFIRHHQYVSFLCVGFINTLFGYAIFAFLIYCHLHYILAVFLSTIAGIIFNFHTTGKWVFRHFHLQAFPRFIMTYGIL
ncbi:MAG: GtrA family protein, partial [Gammaproteobacteria bacterium]|nr:GtrA family protein [Gammaproteobacteria bacterium]